MTKKFNQYLGKAGHLVVMSEFLIIGWNVAIPEVDIAMIFLLFRMMMEL